VAEKCGYQLEGTFRQFFFVRGKYVDYVQYSLLRHECQTLAQALKA
jgi:RimJ/RimL family protein N-acetyltransferase